MHEKGCYCWYQSIADLGGSHEFRLLEEMDVESHVGSPSDIDSNIIRCTKEAVFILVVIDRNCTKHKRCILIINPLSRILMIVCIFYYEIPDE